VFNVINTNNPLTEHKENNHLSPSLTEHKKTTN